MEGLLRAIPVLAVFLINSIALGETGSGETNPGSAAFDFRRPAEAGMRDLQETRYDGALDHFMKAYAQGMSEDSLCYFLAETAFRKSAYDTAMAFNLTIPTPAAGAFRKQILMQRYRLYVQTGLHGDALMLADSIPLKTRPGREKGSHKSFDVRLSGGYFHEDNHAARLYPFSYDLGTFMSEGMQYKNQARLLWPLFKAGKSPWSAGTEYEVVKSYAKDSLDYRIGMSLKADDLPFESASVTLSGELGKITGTGFISAYKLESSYLVFSAKAITMIQGGYETEWTGSWERRFDGFWLSYYHDRSLRTGKGFHYSVSVSGIRVDPVRDRNNQPMMYVDDVEKPKPVHYKDATYRDSVPSRGIAAYLQYTTATSLQEITSTSPQGFIIALPVVGFSFPLPWKLSGDVSGIYGLTVYPQGYRWTEAPTPPQFSQAAGDFRGLALNKADGEKYAAVLVRENGGFSEYYGPDPAEEKTIRRIDNQLGGEIGLRRRWGGWGALSLEANLKRNGSTLSGTAPVWIPAWNYGAALRWSRGWEWQ